MKLTKRSVEALKPGEKEQVIWDDVLSGFGLRVKPNGTKTYVIQYRNRDGQSRRLSLGKHGPLTTEQARSVALQRLGEVQAGADPVADRKGTHDAPTLRELAARYLEEHARTKKKARSLREDTRQLERYILPKLGNRKVASLTTHDVGQLHHSLRETPYQANRVLALLSKLFNLAEKWGLRPDSSNPCRHVERYRERKRERFLSADELRRLGEALAAVERERIEPASAVLALRLLLLTGARREEILTLKWDEVDFERACLRLPDSKTGEKVIPLGPAALELLAKAPRIEGNPYVCPGFRTGHHLVGLPQIWGRIRERAGLPGVRIHDLRHSFAAVGASGGLGLPILGALLGHTVPQTTARYAHVAADPLHQAAARISDEIAAHLNGESGEVRQFKPRS